MGRVCDRVVVVVGCVWRGVVPTRGAGKIECNAKCRKKNGILGGLQHAASDFGEHGLGLKSTRG